MNNNLTIRHHHAPDVKYGRLMCRTVTEIERLAVLR